MAKVRVTCSPATRALPKFVPSVVEGVVSPSAMETPLPRTSISGAGVGSSSRMVRVAVDWLPIWALLVAVRVRVRVSSGSSMASCVMETLTVCGALEPAGKVTVTGSAV